MIGGSELENANSQRRGRFSLAFSPVKYLHTQHHKRYKVIKNYRAAHETVNSQTVRAMLHLAVWWWNTGQSNGLQLE